MPAHPELPRGRGHRVVPLAHLGKRPGPSPLGETGPRRDRLVPLGPGLGRAQPVRAAPDAFSPTQHHRPPAQRQIPHPHRPAVLGLGHRPTTRQPPTPPWSAPARSTRRRSHRRRALRSHPTRTKRQQPRHYRHRSPGTP
jgi:hypothetical protein